MEDLLIKGTDSDKKADTQSKIQTNRLIENNPVVTLWTANDPDKFHEAVRQRCAFSLQMGMPPTLVREKIWKRQMSMNGLKQFNEDDLLALARKYRAAPRLIAKACRNIDIVGGDREKLEQLLEWDALNVYGNVAAVAIDNAVPENYDLSLLNGEGNVDVQEQVEKLIEAGKKNIPFALFASGKDGVGLSSVMRYMAEEMVMNPLEGSMHALCAPNPMSPPEQNIMAAFAQAANNRQFLILHDIEALVPDGKHDSDSWATGGLVNIFKEAASKHKVPFVVTTRKKDTPPESFMYMFSHQMRLAEMEAGQNAKAYEMFFNREAPASLSNVGGLSVADFETVKRSIWRMDADDLSDDDLIAMLTQQKIIRTSDIDKKIGFGRT